MRKLLVVLTAVLLVGTGALAAHAQAGKFCPSPETLKFEANGQGQFTIGEKHGGITLTGQSGNSVTFTVDQGFVIDAVCVKAGRTAPFTTNFDADGSTNFGAFTVTSTCTVIDIEPDGDTDLWAQTGTCTVTITRNRGPGISHITFYGDFYTAPAAAEVAVLGAVETEGGAQGGAAAGGLAFTGAQITILLLLLGALVGAGGLALAAGRRRASRAE